MLTFLGFVASLLFLNVVDAAPLFGLGNSDSSDPVSNVSTTDTDALVRPARFAQIAYCSAGAVLSWKCGPPCDAIPGIEPVVAGGDDGLIPMYFIAHDPTENSVIVAHQGTNSRNILSIINDAQVLLVGLDGTLFPNASSDIKVHDGFQKTFQRTAPEVLGNVTQTIQSTGAKKVEVIGHSLGAAVAVMDAMLLRQNLDPNVDIVTRVFGLPRGGNQAWANFVDQTLTGMVHVHNKDDPVGTVPPRFLDYQHPSGEFHIQSDNSTVNCLGQENQDDKCIDGQSLVSSLGNIDDHSGPYFDGIQMGGKFCPL